ncbi:MAG TPA: Hpt domain-containing protein [Myxococcota bacterium]|nr:Hpt domain-containing protein [Myxococcota bacterium]
MLEIVREFALELPGRADALERLLASGSLAELSVLAHQLKGAGGGYGYAPVSELAGALERALREGRPRPEIEQRTHELSKLLRAVVAPELP